MHAYLRTATEANFCIKISVTKNPHCACARTVTALYGCGLHSNHIFQGHWTLKKDFREKKFTVESENIALLNHIFFRTLEKSMLLRINLQVRLETLIK